MNNYETVFILNPVLSEDQIEEAVNKYEKLITKFKAKLIAKENWGLKKFAYPIQNKKSGFYHLIEYQGSVGVSKNIEMEFRRDERVMRYLTVKLEKHALDWSEKRRKKLKEKSKA